MYTVFLKHLTISTIRKVSTTIQVYGLSNMPLVCLHWHQCWYTHDLSMSGNQLSVGNKTFGRLPKRPLKIVVLPKPGHKLKLKR
jgi:hypothetical protein